VNKNTLFLAALSLIHIPLLPIAIGACTFEKDGQRVDVFGEAYIQPVQAESENAGVIQKQHAVCVPISSRIQS